MRQTSSSGFQLHFEYRSSVTSKTAASVVSTPKYIVNTVFAWSPGRTAACARRPPALLRAYLSDTKNGRLSLKFHIVVVLFRLVHRDMLPQDDRQNGDTERARIISAKHDPSRRSAVFAQLQSKTPRVRTLERHLFLQPQRTWPSHLRLASAPCLASRRSFPFFW